MNNTKPIMRSTDMHPQYQRIVMKIAQEQMDLYYDIESKIFQVSNRVKRDIHREFLQLNDVGYAIRTDENPWSVAVGKNFAVVTDGKRGWSAHVYLRNTVSMLVWRTQ